MLAPKVEVVIPRADDLDCSMTDAARTKPEADSARRHFAHGALWSAINAGASVAVPLVIFVAFARLAEPQFVGLVALAGACAEMLKPFGAPGLYEALLQHRADRTDLHESASAMMLLSGLALIPVYVLLIAVLAMLVPGVEAHQWALNLIGLRIVFDLASTQPQARLAQALSYRRLALRAVVANGAAGTIGIGVAAAGAPLAGLVTYSVAQSILAFAFTAAARGALARPRMHAAGWALLREGWAASAVRLVSASNNYLDQIVIGAVIGSSLLAFFNLAKRIETVFITAASAFSAVLFQPLFAAVDGPARSDTLRRSLCLLTLLCGAPTAVLAVHGTLAVTTVFGAQWAPAAMATSLLAASGLARALGGVHGALLSVSGRNRQLLAVAAVSATLGVGVVVPAAAIGIAWCAAALAIKNAAFAAAEAWMTRADLPGLGTVYLLDVAMPLLLMLLGAGLGRWVGDGWAAQGLAADLGRLALSGVLALVVAGPYLLLRHRDVTKALLMRRRAARLARLAA